MIDTTGGTPVTPWFTSSYSLNADDCVQVRFDGDTVLIRDSKHHGHGPTITATTDQWTAFLYHTRD